MILPFFLLSNLNGVTKEIHPHRSQAGRTVTGVGDMQSISLDVGANSWLEELGLPYGPCSPTGVDSDCCPICRRRPGRSTAARHRNNCCGHQRLFEPRANEESGANQLVRSRPDAVRANS